MGRKEKKFLCNKRNSSPHVSLRIYMSFCIGHWSLPMNLQASCGALLDKLPPSSQFLPFNYQNWNFGVQFLLQPLYHWLSLVKIHNCLLKNLSHKPKSLKSLGAHLRPDHTSKGNCCQSFRYYFSMAFHLIGSDNLAYLQALVAGSSRLPPKVWLQSKLSLVHITSWACLPNPHRRANASSHAPQSAGRRRWSFWSPSQWSPESQFANHLPSKVVHTSS